VAIGIVTNTITPNLAGPVDAPIARLFAFVRQGWRATDQRRLWQRRHPQAMWLDECVELCRQCPRLAPFCNFNGNTFAAIARQLTQEIKLRPDEAHVVRSWAGHIVAGTATEIETNQFLQFSRSLTPDRLKKS
jgi:hypothetical protein